jgi:type I restriction enzyme S subunit
LLKRIAQEKARLVKAGELKKVEPVANFTDSDDALPLPTGWAITNLQSVCVSVTDGDHLPPPKAETGIPFLVIGNVRSQRIDFTESRFVPSQYYDALDPIRRPRGGDLLYTLVGSYGIPVIVRDDRPFCVQRHIGILRPSQLINVNFLARAMESRFAFAQATACATGIAQKTVPLSGLRKLLLPLPPLAEQHRIAAKVEELMALCDRLEAARTAREATRDRLATASLGRLNAPDPETFQADARFALDALPALTTRPDQIKQLRQTILNLAVRGKLVPQNTEEEPASELLKRIAKEKARVGVKHVVSPLGGAEIPFDLPIGWSWSRIGEVCAKTGSGSTPRGGKEVYKDSGVPFLRSQNIYDDGLRLNDVAYIDQETHSRMSGTKVLPGDLLLNITGGSIGRCCRIPDDFKEANVSQHVAIIRTAVGGTEDFLHRLILSPYFQAFVIDEQTGAGRGGLPKNRMDQIAVALPPLAEQHRIVAKVDALMVLCDRLEASLTAAGATRRRLLDALLAEALAPADARELEAAE